MSAPVVVPGPVLPAAEVSGPALPAVERVIRIVPSVLPVDFARLGEEVAALEAAGADRLQWDVMDGQFVPNLTMGPDIIAAARRHVALPFEAHLMVLEPDPMLPRWVEAGCELVIVHAEACRHLHRTLMRIREIGARAGVALNPATPVDAARHVLDLVDLVLVMTVNPGFGGQDYIAAMEEKIRSVRSLVDATGRVIDVEVDGGISAATIAGSAAAGADVFVAGSAVARHPGGPAAAIAELRALAQRAVV